VPAEPDPLRVVHVCQPVDGGAALVCLRLAVVAREAGHGVEVVCPPTGDLPSWLDEEGIARHPLPMHRRPDLSDLLAVARLRRLLRGADVVHLHSSKAGALGRAAVLGLRRRPAVIFQPHGWSWYVGGRLARLYVALERTAARWTDTIVAVSDEELADGRAVLGALGDRAVVIPNGVDTARYSPDGERADRSSDPLLVCVGRLCEQKGQDLAIGALALLADQSVRLRLVGEGPDRAALEGLAEHHGVAHRVELTGSVDPRPHLRAADVVVLPSRWEGMSLLLLEAMSCGAAIAVTAVGGHSVVRDSAEVLTLPASAGTLAAALEPLLSDDDRRRRMGERARAVAIADLGQDAVLQRYVDLWQQLSKGRRRR